MIRYLFVYQNPGPADAIPLPSTQTPTASTAAVPPVDHHQVPDVHVDQVMGYAVRMGHHKQ